MPSVPRGLVASAVTLSQVARSIYSGATPTAPPHVMHPPSRQLLAHPLSRRSCLLAQRRHLLSNQRLLSSPHLRHLRRLPLSLQRLTSPRTLPPLTPHPLTLTPSKQPRRTAPRYARLAMA